MKNLKNIDTSRLDTKRISSVLDSQCQMYSMQRKSFERKWYDNNFFDDGYHFRYVSRLTGKIIDSSDSTKINSPSRAIPKASRQLRGIVNLLTQADYLPVIYPEKILRENYQSEEEYIKAKDISKISAKKVGHWLLEEWKDQEMKEKLALMLLLAGKNSVSYMQIWPDAVEQKIRTKVYDAFDILTMGNLTSIYDSPSIIKIAPQLISKIKANENFDEEQVNKISPDNKYASSEIKNAYMNTRFGFNTVNDNSATLLLKEGYIKEYLNDDNLARIKKQKDGDLILEGKKKGDVVIRQVFSAGGVWLRDVYTALPEYPFVDFRYEPGQLYQTSLIERFIPQNKSLDTLISRLEKYSNTMVTGVWQKRKGENFDITNVQGAQVINYKTTPLVQGNIAPIPAFYFNLIGLLNSFIEEQGVSTTALGKVPKGVKAGVAIESLKESEFANLKMAVNQLKGTVQRIGQRFLDLGARYFVLPETVEVMDKGEPDYFDIVGERGLEVMKKNGQDIKNVIPLKKDYKIEIEVENGEAYTMQGKREILSSFVDKMLGYAKEGLISSEAIKIVLQRFVETFQYGSLQEFTEALDQPNEQFSEEQIQAVKVAMAEVIKDTGMGDSEGQIMTSKIGTIEALKDAGMVKKPKEGKQPSETLNYKDAPSDVKRQIEAQAGLQPSQLPPEEVLNAVNQGQKQTSNK